MGRFYLLRALFTAFLCLCLSGQLCAQSYGVAFYGHEVDQDKRTSLDLTPAEPLCLNENFDMAFDFTFLTGKKTYFGYIFRVIENDKRNFDLVYDNDADVFTLIIGEELTKIKFRIPQYNLYNKWNKLYVGFNISDNSISLTYNKHTYTHKVTFTKSGCFKFLYGANTYKNFGSADVPPMKVREIKITRGNSLRYYWPLNEKSGTEWLKAEHYYWKLLSRFRVNGSPSTAFNADNEELYIIANDTVYTYSPKRAGLKSEGFPYKNNSINIGNQSIYSHVDGKLYNFYVDDDFITVYNPGYKGFDKPFTASPITDNIQVNKLISAADTSLYIFGGYGHHQYKNRVKRYSFNTKTWSDVKTTGDFFTPRYMSALGTTANGDTAYIAGGFGNASGKQILKPKNLYDVMRFVVKNKRFEKLFDLQPKHGDFVFGNSLIINEKDKTYHALIFPELRFDSQLQLIKGSLQNNSYTLVGNAIPYLFNDIRSYADVFYCPESKKFLVVTILRTMDDKNAEVKIFGLTGPPETADSPVVIKKQTASNWWFWVFVAVVLALGLVYGFVNFGRRKKTELQTLPLPGELVSNNPLQPVTTPSVTEPPVVTAEEIIIPQPKHDNHAQIYLFGELQLVTKNGKEIVNSFTRLTKELFVYLFLHSVRWNRGVSAEKLIEILWFDKDEKSARNNRSVNMAKLKNVLDLLGPCTISRDTGYYKIDVDYNEINVDFHHFLKIVNDHGRLTKEKMIQLAEITQRGNFLVNCEYEWLDQQKAEVTDDIIDTYLRYLHNTNIQDEPEFCIKITNHIFQHDHVNEEAMRIKCRALVYLGKHSLAKSTFENFRKEYKSIYLEEFKEDYPSVLE
ncbi:MAG: galactose oxidase [Sphingobacteriales bacterium]|nr:MAG: galactose oxidase [Sphingobacteriales bacterium]